MQGTKVKLEIVLNALERGIQRDNGALVRLKGQVLRTGPYGMAISFKKPYKILPMPV